MAKDLPWLAKPLEAAAAAHPSIKKPTVTAAASSAPKFDGPHPSPHDQRSNTDPAHPSQRPDVPTGAAGSANSYWDPLKK